MGVRMAPLVGALLPKGTFLHFGQRQEAFASVPVLASLPAYPSPAVKPVGMETSSPAVKPAVQLAGEEAFSPAVRPASQEAFSPASKPAGSEASSPAVRLAADELSSPAQAARAVATVKAVSPRPHTGLTTGTAAVSSLHKHCLPCTGSVIPAQALSSPAQAVSSPAQALSSPAQAARAAARAMALASAAVIATLVQGTPTPALHPPCLCTRGGWKGARRPAPGRSSSLENRSLHSTPKALKRGQGQQQRQRQRQGQGQRQELRQRQRPG